MKCHQLGDNRWFFFNIRLMPFMALILLSSVVATAQSPRSNEQIKEMIAGFKSDIRGPYKDIRWFCNDGTFREPKERCPEPSPQRARYKDEVIALGKTNNIFLGQILSTTIHDEFWDAANANSRAKQYQIEKYLRSVDDGWVLKKGQYYRGAIQAEDEQNWGYHFFVNILEKDVEVEKNFFLIREAARDITHQGDDNSAQTIRSISLVISEEYPGFMNLRIKIHGQPDASDIEQIRNFKTRNQSKLNESLSARFDELLKEMELYYRPVQKSSFSKYTKRLTKGSEIATMTERFLAEYYQMPSGKERIRKVSEQLYSIRGSMLSLKKGGDRLALMDISLLIEKMLLQDLQDWQPQTIYDLHHATYSLGLALAGTGYLETHEWQSISKDLVPSTQQEISLASLKNYFERSRSLVEWETGMVKAIYQPTVTLFSGFEPLANGFIDDRVRSSLLLPLGRFVGSQGDFFAKKAGLTNKVLDIPYQGHMRGLNPGYAFGELVVSEGTEVIEVESNRIYVFEQPPADLKPVAGIATVSEGNAVSHVQLLARNLGIPNMILSKENLIALKSYAGQKVFYAVSNSGTVMMKLDKDMNAEEKLLFAEKKRAEDKIRVPVENIMLDNNKVVNLREIRSNDSGKLCGPKAANLGQLKAMFPDQVVEGMAIPFGIFLEHMRQTIPNESISYWAKLNLIFKESNDKLDAGMSMEEVDLYTLEELAKLREAIKKIVLIPSFVADLESSFVNILGKPMGQIPVFLRSDTNMEDLKDFTGAGLNLTVFNAASREKILQGIKDVWASPYTERSYKWRQKYLLNPENVYPSILIIPSVDVDYSGVLITKGVATNDSEALTIAFSRGAGGAVDGQAAESYMLLENGENIMLSPSREPFYNRLPMTGGTSKNIATYYQPILNQSNLAKIRALSDDVKRILPNTPGIESEGPFDIELGFKDDKLWLFQIRPFVENKKALASTYLISISPKIDETITVKMNAQLD
ncbi:MAG: PEP/pyruvate-binding domain-containing protein [Cyclobacteriaceae bacterium]